MNWRFTPFRADVDYIVDGTGELANSGGVMEFSGMEWLFYDSFRGVETIGSSVLAD